MTWKKYFNQSPTNTNPGSFKSSGASHGSFDKDAAWLPEYYSGSQDRIHRYAQYDTMDLDHEVHLALNTIAEFCVQDDEDNKLPFEVSWVEDPTESETETINRLLRQWCELNEWRRRAVSAFRGTIKYGDQFFIRDPETFKLHWVDVADVKYVIVNEADNKRIEFYAMANISFNLKDGVASDFDPNNTHNANNLSVQHWSKSAKTTGVSSANTDEEITYISADHVVHISMSEGMNMTWPFGVSELEKVFKIYKQKELLEDSILIYRIHRAPERRVFFIDTGDLPPHKAKAHLESTRMEVQQKRIPQKTGNGENNIMDSAYNPLSMIEDYFFAVTASGRGSRVETLPGGQGLGEIDDLKYFNNKLIRALSIPSSYLPTGPEDGTAPYQDGKVSNAFIQEFRFDRYCRRLQNIVIDELNHEFKMYCKHSGIRVDTGTFDIQFCEPQNFSNYREVEMNMQFASAYAQMSDYEHISKRFAMKKYLGWDDNDILENERLWKQENGIKDEAGEEIARTTVAREAGLTSSAIKQYQNKAREE
ncbi:MAG: hypothetical protein CMN60_20515 [Sphingobium sp.]|nr:hypothetical protein [Sphingobium sp.]|tara:strand:- start:17934 stop:19538 length:1605 start_codon:yes stop_codon:yes gene_type:complete